MAKEIIFGTQKIKYIEQFDSSQYTLDHTHIKAIIDKTSQDGTGVTPDKRRNEISIQNGASYNYTFQLKVNGSQKDAIANLWQIKAKHAKYPSISIGVKRVNNVNKLAYKSGSESSQIIGDIGTHDIKVNCKKGELFVDNKKITTFDAPNTDDTIAKFGIEADKDCVDGNITSIYSDIKLELI